MQEFSNQYLDPVFQLLNYNLINLGGTTITPTSILIALLLLIVLIYTSGKAQRLLVGQLQTRTKLDTGAREAIGTIARYLVLFVGLLIIFQSIGIDLTALSVLTGAVGIGIGFGLQNIANNFISGLILLLERPIKVGDRIEVDDVNGDVVAIRARSTYVRTNDNITVIVPNSKFISENVINWSFDGGIIRFKIPVGVAYDTDVDLVTKLLTDVAKADPDVAKEPAPSVRLMSFGDNALEFELRAWSRDRLSRPGLFKSNLNYAIVRAFRENGIEMPFPQRDIWVRDGQLGVHNANGRKEKHETAKQDG